MSYSCCICGLILASEDWDFPQWCKDIRALCWYGCQPILSGIGSHEDSDVVPFNLPIPLNGFNRFHFRCYLDELQDHCYPFHAACWMILEQINGGEIFNPDIAALFRVFESVHYYRRAGAMNWGHNYYLEDLLAAYSGGQDDEHLRENIIRENKDNLDILADPSRFKLLENGAWKQPQRYSRLLLKNQNHTNLYGPRSADYGPIDSTHHCRGLLSLPYEILELIMCDLDFHDAQHLLRASAPLYRQYGANCYNLPSSFWQSRFWTHGKAGFAPEIPSSCSRRDWFFTVKFELKDGPDKMNLQNRKRVWKLGIELIDLVGSIEQPNRCLRGDIPTSIHSQVRGSTASCIAEEYDSQGCRELTQRFVRLDNNSRLCSVIPSYVVFSCRRMISGLSFVFSDGEHVDVGYVLRRQGDDCDYTASLNHLWLVVSQLGFEAISVDAYPQQILDSFTSSYRRKLAVAEWSLEKVKGFYVGLDAIRIVRISIDAGEQDCFDDILWTPPCPPPGRFMHEDDIKALHQIQSRLFAPASTHSLNLDYGRLIGIKVYGPLGYCAGITGIGFVYDTDVESVWGDVHDASSLIFFLDTTERLVAVTIYKIGSSVHHLQFTSDLGRTSLPFPQLPAHPRESLECVRYGVSRGGHITGLCGSFVDFHGYSRQLNCLGVIPTMRGAWHMSVWVHPKPPAPVLLPEGQLTDMPLGGIRAHDEHQSSISLKTKYQSIQASINPTISMYRRAGQVTGLLFRTANDQSHPELLGQWTGAGATYDLLEGEQIVGLEVTTIKPVRIQYSRPFVTQVENLTVVTTQRRINLGSGNVEARGQESTDVDLTKNAIIEINWEFNAILDRIRCTYQ